MSKRNALHNSTLLRLRMIALVKNQPSVFQSQGVHQYKLCLIAELLLSRDCRSKAEIQGGKPFLREAAQSWPQNTARIDCRINRITGMPSFKTLVKPWCSPEFSRHWETDGELTNRASPKLTTKHKRIEAFLCWPETCGNHLKIHLWFYFIYVRITEKNSFFSSHQGIIKLISDVFRIYQDKEA